MYSIHVYVIIYRLSVYIYIYIDSQCNLTCGIVPSPFLKICKMGGPRGSKFSKLSQRGLILLSITLHLSALSKRNMTSFYNKYVRTWFLLGILLYMYIYVYCIHVCSISIKNQIHVPN